MDSQALSWGRPRACSTSTCQQADGGGAGRGNSFWSGAHMQFSSGGCREQGKLAPESHELQPPSLLASVERPACPAPHGVGHGARLAARLLAWPAQLHYLTSSTPTLLRLSTSSGPVTSRGNRGTTTLGAGEGRRGEAGHGPGKAKPGAQGGGGRSCCVREATSSLISSLSHVPCCLGPTSVATPACWPACRGGRGRGTPPPGARCSGRRAQGRSRGQTSPAEGGGHGVQHGRSRQSEGRAVATARFD